MKTLLRSSAALTVLLTLAVLLHADEGMYPLSDIARINLPAKGLKIPVKEIYNPGGVSLVNAICDLGGGTGEFVSADGLILTNHHIAFPVVAEASTPERDYLKNGFTARTREEEIPAKGFTCNITESYRDVSADVLAAVTEGMPPAERSKALRARMNDIATKETGGRQNIICRVAEMFPGTSYVLFTYRALSDVRLVYAPPIGIGNFGGEDDNWMWPRHTGDFSFLRAYTAPDGSTASYAKDNVPYRPKRFLRLGRRGVKEGDFVMVLGYPGRTFKHKVAAYLRLQQEVQLPYIADHYDGMIRIMEENARSDRALQLRFATQIKGYANTMKNYRGKLQGLRRLGLVAKKEAQERELQAFIDRTPAASRKYGTTLRELGRVYDDARRVMKQELIAAQFTRNRIVGIATMLFTPSVQKESPEQRRETERQIGGAYDDMHLRTEAQFLARLIAEERDLPAEQRFLGGRYDAVLAEEDGERALAKLLADRLAHGVFSSRERLLAALSLPAKELAKDGDPFIAIAGDVGRAMDAVRERQRVRDGELSRLEADLLDAKMLWQEKTFIPDANSTLRLTYGYIRGYAPADATRFAPFTTLRGVVQKHTAEDPFDAPAELLRLAETRDFDRYFLDPALKDVPVAMLYNLDTTGGNSGSPVLNAWGELVGVNFDRTFEATINDYQWSEDYSRSIGVDIRYVLFIAKYIGHADALIAELGVPVK